MFQVHSKRPIQPSFGQQHNMHGIFLQGRCPSLLSTRTEGHIVKPVILGSGAVHDNDDYFIAGGCFTIICCLAITDLPL